MQESPGETSVGLPRCQQGIGDRGGRDEGLDTTSGRPNTDDRGQDDPGRGAGESNGERIGETNRGHEESGVDRVGRELDSGGRSTGDWVGQTGDYGNQSSGPTQSLRVS